MELQEFINTTLSEIVAGVKDFQDAMNEGAQKQDFVGRFVHGPYQIVNFDIALAEGGKAGGKGGVGVFLGGLALGGQVTGETTSSSHTRVSFPVPIKLSGVNRPKEVGGTVGST